MGNSRKGDGRLLEAITKKYTEESEGGTYRFTFYCDICGHPWRSFPMKPVIRQNGLSKAGRVWKDDHAKAFEHANIEAMNHFNRCPVCKRRVCDDCFRILEDMNMCKECAGKRENSVKGRRHTLVVLPAYGLPDNQTAEKRQKIQPWLQRIIAGHKTGPPHISGNNTADEKARRIDTLSDEEREAYRWLFEGYSERWTTETLSLDKPAARLLFKSVYRKLGVVSSREIVHYYPPNEVRFRSPDGADKMMKK